MKSKTDSRSIDTDPEKIRSALRKDLGMAPTGPGVYLMKDEDGTIIYIGKARSLKKRLASYFSRTRPPDLKTALLVKKISSFETIVTQTEKEALILEATLVKRQRPKYNVNLKDDKRYPSLCLDLSHPYPNMTIVRKTNRKDVRYFGPFSSAQGVRETLKFINKTFKLRKCKNREFATRQRPCLHYQMDACLAPCCLRVEQSTYQAIIKEVTLFLNGRTPKLVRQLKKKMAQAAAVQLFEEAAGLRDKIYSLERTLEKQVAVTTDFADRDVLGLAGADAQTLITIMSVRGGVLVGTRHYLFDNPLMPDADVLEAFARSHYEQAPIIPPEILVPIPLENRSMIGDWLSDIAGRNVKIRWPQRGRKVVLITMANENATMELKKRTTRQAEDREILRTLQNRLHLPRLPVRIECFDNSNLSGTHPVAAMVVFLYGRPHKQDYRKYTLNPHFGSDDYAAMAEALTRRFQSRSAPQNLPDLLVVDGGKGQLNVALAVLKKLDLIDRFSVIGLAKKDEHRGEVMDKVYLPGRANPVSMTRHMKALHLLERVRDEAHRFAITFQRRRRTRIAMGSIIDEIPGVGPRRKQALLAEFVDIRRIAAASIDELAAVPGMNRPSAEKVFTTLAPKNEKSNRDKKK